MNIYKRKHCSSLQVRGYFNTAVDPLLIILLTFSIEFGWPMTSDELDIRKGILERKGILQHVHLPGSHHPHMDPETAPAVSSHVEQFLGKIRVPRREL